jgi:zinc transporter 1/2/3
MTLDINRNPVVTLSAYKAAAALLIFLTSVVISLYLLKRKNALNRGEQAGVWEALASGIFLGAAFFHMLPDAIRTFSHLYPTITYPVPELVCVSGFLLLLLLERVSLTNHHARAKNYIPYILALTLIIHALSEGAALGLETAYAETVMLFIAILAHKGSESFGLCILLLRYALPYRHIVITLIFFAVMTPLGIFLGEAINSSGGSELMASLFTAFAAGTFLYISTLHHVHFHQHGDEAQGMLEFGCLTTGVIIMGVIAFWT